MTLSHEEMNHHSIPFASCRPLAGSCTGMPANPKSVPIVISGLASSIPLKSRWLVAWRSSTSRRHSGFVACNHALSAAFSVRDRMWAERPCT